MAHPNTNDQTPVFLQIEPNWAGDVRLTQRWWTDITMANSGTEQRARRREKPLYDFMFRYNALQTGTFSARHMSMIKELGAPIVLPIWSHRFDFLSEAADVVTLDVTSGIKLSKTPFQVGQYAYFVDPGGVYTSTFRLITAISDTGTITCEAGTVSYPSGGSVQPYQVGDFVYPALIGIRKESAFTVERHRVTLTDEIMDFSQL